MKDGSPGVSMRLTFVPCHSKDDSAALMDMPRACSSSSASETVVPSTTEPEPVGHARPRTAAPRAGRSCRLPRCPTRATLRMRSAAACGMRGKLSRLDARVIIPAAAPFAAGALLPIHAVLDGPQLCPFQAATGVPCPLCGATRAFVLAAHLDARWLEYGAVWVVAFALVAGAGTSRPDARSRWSRRSSWPGRGRWPTPAPSPRRDRVRPSVAQTEAAPARTAMTIRTPKATPIQPSAMPQVARPSPVSWSGLLPDLALGRGAQPDGRGGGDQRAHHEADDAEDERRRGVARGALRRPVRLRRRAGPGAHGRRRRRGSGRGLRGGPVQRRRRRCHRHGGLVGDRRGLLDDGRLLHRRCGLRLRLLDGRRRGRGLLDGLRRAFLVIVPEEPNGAQEPSSELNRAGCRPAGGT